MYFVGVDLAWGELNQSGIAVIHTDGRLLHVGVAQDDSSIADAVAPYTSDECLVAIDAPLIVKNATGHRSCEAALNRDFQKFEAGARPAFTGRPEFAQVPRGARLANLLGLDMDPDSRASRRAIEVYPHPATVALFGLGRDPQVKRGAIDDRRGELLRLMTLIEELDGATPRLRVNHNVAWVELRNRVAAATRQVQLDSTEDPVDAPLVRIHRALLVSASRGRHHLRRLCERLHRHANSSARPGAAQRGPAPVPATDDHRTDLLKRLARAEALLADAMAELTAIRERLRRE